MAIAALLLAGALVLAHLARGQTFYADEWDWILNRRDGGLRTFLAPHEQHLSLVPLIVYRLLFAVAGIRHYWPYLAVVIAAPLVCAGLVYAYAAPRVGSLFALLTAALVLFFGPGSIDFLWPFQMACLFSVSCAIGALIALDRRADIVASVLMGVALASAGPGLAVALGLAVEMVWTRGRRGLWMAAVPLGLFALWWIFYQQAGVLRDSVLHVASFMANAAATTAAGLAGLLSVDVTTDTSTFRMWGPVLLVLAVGALVWRLRQSGTVRPRVVALLVMVLGFWLITALGRGAFQAGILVLSETGDESRYTYIGAVLVVLLAVELARGWKPSARVAVPVAAVLVAAIISNLGVLRQQAQYLRNSGAATAAYLGTLDMTRSVVSPGFASAGFLLGIVQAGQYFAAERALGSPAWSPSKLARADDGVRQAADLQLIAIHRFAFEAAREQVAPGPAPTVDPGGGGALPSGQCLRVRAPLPGAGAAGSVAFTVPPSGVEVVADGGSAAVAVRRFSTRFDPLGTLTAGMPAILRIAADQAPQPWHLLVTPTEAATVCGLRP